MKHQALPSIFVHQGQPLERTSPYRPIVDEVAGPDVVLEPSRLLRATIRTDPWLGAEFPGFSQPHGPPQPEAVPEPTNPLEIDRPTPSHKQSVNHPVSVSRMPPRQALNLPDQGRLVGPVASTVSERRTRPAQDAADPPLRGSVPLAQVVSSGPLLVWAHHFFLAMSWSICLSRSSSATSRFRRSSSSSSSRHRRSVSTWTGSCRCRHR